MSSKVQSHKRGLKKLNVLIKFAEKELLVGKLILENRLIYFRYDQEFLKLGLNLSPFKLTYDHSIQVADPMPFHGIFGLFDDSLPDGWGMLLLNRALEKKGLSLNDINILDQLAYIGENAKGALIYRPAIEENQIYTNDIDLDRLKTAIDKIYYGTSHEVIEKLLSLGGSSGGARPKANVAYNPDTDQLIHGIDPLPEGYSHWIIKFTSADDTTDAANIEYAYYQIALAAGIQMSECKLLESSHGLQVFATKRFDREGNHRIHMHSMAGLTHDNFRLSNIDYGHIIDIAYHLEKTALSRERILRLAAFNVYGHNRDDHSKNFSWLMDKQGNWRFAPAYDLTYSSIGIDEHSTRVVGEGAFPGRKHLLKLADMYSIKNANIIIDEVQMAFTKWPQIAASAGVSQGSIDRIQSKIIELRD